jgi:membrane fusion protein, multidrug efflux system
MDPAGRGHFSKMDNYMVEEEKPATESLPRARPRSKARWAIGALVVVAVAAAGVWLHYRNRVSTDDAEVDGHIVPISARISGSVIQVLVSDNQHVNAGDVLVRLDPRDYQARVNQAKAALALAESQARAAQVTVPLTRETTQSGTSGMTANLETAEAQARQAKLTAQQAATSELAWARSNLAAAQASNEKAQADVERMRPLAAKSEISQQQFDAYVAEGRVAAAQLKAAQDRVHSAEQTAENAQEAAQAAQSRVSQARAELRQSRAGQQQVQVNEAQAASALAKVQQARADLETAELNLSYTTITAPTEGQVTKKSVEAGQIVQPGQGLMTIIPLQDVWVTANFKETQLANVHPGQKAEVHVDMYGRTIEGRVNSIAGGTGARLSLLPPENATGNFVKVVQRIPVKITFDSMPPGVVLRPGMNVDATIITK